MADVWVNTPQLLAALPCEDIAVSAAMGDGRVSFQRVYYDVYADGFPAAFHQMNVATVWMGGQGQYAVGARLSDPGGQVLAEASATYVARPQPAQTVQVFHFSADGGMTLLLPLAGRYAVDVLLEGVPVHSFPIFAIGPEESDGASG